MSKKKTYRLAPMTKDDLVAVLQRAVREADCRKDCLAHGQTDEVLHLVSVIHERRDSRGWEKRIMHMGLFLEEAASVKHLSRQFRKDHARWYAQGMDLR